MKCLKIFHFCTILLIQVEARIIFKVYVRLENISLCNGNSLTKCRPDKTCFYNKENLGILKSLRCQKTFRENILQWISFRMHKFSVRGQSKLFYENRCCWPLNHSRNSWFFNRNWHLWFSTTKFAKTWNSYFNFPCLKEDFSHFPLKDDEFISLESLKLMKLF